MITIIVIIIIMIIIIFMMTVIITVIAVFGTKPFFVDVWAARLRLTLMRTCGDFRFWNSPFQASHIMLHPYRVRILETKDAETIIVHHFPSTMLAIFSMGH